jgi:hypothetical protein
MTSSFEDGKLLSALVASLAATYQQQQASNGNKKIMKKVVYQPVSNATANIRNALLDALQVSYY